MKVYIVEAVSNSTGGTKISSEGYLSLRAAQDFVRRRKSLPMKITDFIYISKNYDYTITEVEVN